jgi:hypothetical protein
MSLQPLKWFDAVPYITVMYVSLCVAITCFLYVINTVIVMTMNEVPCICLIMFCYVHSPMVIIITVVYLNPDLDIITIIRVCGPDIYPLLFLVFWSYSLYNGHIFGTPYSHYNDRVCGPLHIHYIDVIRGSLHIS